MFWTVFLAVLAANALTVGALYLLIAHAKGVPFAQSAATLFNGATTLGWRAIQLYIGLLFLGGLAYAAKLLIFGGG